MEKAKKMKMNEETPEPSSPEGVVVDLEEITTRRVRLSDVDDLMKWAIDEEVNRFVTLDTHPSRDEVIEYINNEAIPDPWLNVICIKDIAIGAITVRQNSGNYDKYRGELGYCLAKKYWSKGIMTKVVKMFIPTIFQEWPDLERLEATVEVNNMASQRVLEKARFQREGVLRRYRTLKGRTVDLVMFSILSSDLYAGLSLA